MTMWQTTRTEAARSSMAKIPQARLSAVTTRAKAAMAGPFNDGLFQGGPAAGRRRDEALLDGEGLLDELRTAGHVGEFLVGGLLGDLQPGVVILLRHLDDLDAGV